MGGSTQRTLWKSPQKCMYFQGRPLSEQKGQEDWIWVLMFPGWNTGCFGIEQTHTKPLEHILWYFELPFGIPWYSGSLKCICFLWINLKIKRDCFCRHLYSEGGKMPCRDINKATPLHQLSQKTKTRPASEHGSEVLSLCLFVRIWNFSKNLILWLSGILDISVARRKVQVRTESILIEQHQVTQSLKKLNLLELSLHWNTLERKEVGRGNLPGIYVCSAWFV